MGKKKNIDFTVLIIDGQNKKNSESVTPADHFRKKIKQKEIIRNRKERYFNRDAISKSMTNAEELIKELSDLLAIEEKGKQLNKLERLKKKVLQEQFSAGIRRSMEEKKRDMLEQHGQSVSDSQSIYDPIKAAMVKI